MDEYIKPMLIWLVCAVVAYNVFVLISFKTGAVGRTRDEQGHLKKKQGAKGILTMAAVSLLFLGVVYLYDYTLFGNADPGICTALLFNAILIMSIVLYDFFVIDLLVIGVIRPKFLNLPETMNLVSMKEHVRKQFTVGWVFVLPLILIPSVLFVLIN